MTLLSPPPLAIPPGEAIISFVTPDLLNMLPYCGGTCGCFLGWAPIQAQLAIATLGLLVWGDSISSGRY